MIELALKGLDKRFGAVRVIKDVDLHIAPGEFIVFVGPSGSGKSTLLRMIAGLEEIDGGDLFVDGVRFNDTPPARRGIAMVFQSYALYPHLNIRRNLGFALETEGLSRDEIATRVQSTAEMLKIDHLLDRKPSQLSGGQQQRVAIGRAVVRSQQLFLFDEPLSNLDADLRMEMRVEIAKLHDRLGSTTIYVTHDQMEAMTLADRIVVLKDGRIAQVGTPMELYNHPASRFVAGFIGAPRMNFLDGEVTDGVLMLAGAYLPWPGAHEGPLALGVRPEGVCFDGGDLCLPVQVSLIEPLGGEALIHLVASDSQAIVARYFGMPSFQQGDTIEIGIRLDRAYAFDAGDQAIWPPRPEAGQ